MRLVLLPDVRRPHMPPDLRMLSHALIASLGTLAFAVQVDLRHKRALYRSLISHCHEHTRQHCVRLTMR